MGGLRDGQIGWRMVILPTLGGGFKHVLFSSLRELIQFNEYFSNGLNNLLLMTGALSMKIEKVSPN